MLPFMTQKNNNPPFYALDDELPLVLAISSGLQHALAMLAGLITPPIIFASTLNLPPDVSAYMISASLIGCGERHLGPWPGNVMRGDFISPFFSCFMLPGSSEC